MVKGRPDGWGKPGLTYVYYHGIDWGTPSLGMKITHKYPRTIGLIQGFPIGVRWDRGTSNYPPKCSAIGDESYFLINEEPSRSLGIFWESTARLLGCPRKLVAGW